MEESQIINIIVYIILFIIFGYIFGHYLSKQMVPLREGARTLPRPVINPRVSEYETDKKEKLILPGETMNQMIDQFISKYFNKDGFPLESTIVLYTTYCCNKGNVTPENKRKLTDIGYYILDIVIPNLRSNNNNSDPKTYWPPIKWSNHNIFNILIQPTETSQVIRGQNYKGVYVKNISSSDSGNFWDDLFGNDSSSSTDGGSDQNNNNNDNQGAADSCSSAPKNNCGIGCPTSCLSSAIAASLPPPSQGGSGSGSGGTSGSSSNNNENSGGSAGSTNNPNNTANTTFLPGGLNEIIIGSADIDGYQITDCLQKQKDGSELNDMINEFIKTYFIDYGPNVNRPTQAAIDLFNQLDSKSPMDGFHMNKMRDLVFYVLQVIVPGLPTKTYVSGTPAINKSDSSYVEWRPIRWLSLSEKP